MPLCNHCSCHCHLDNKSRSLLSKSVEGNMADDGTQQALHHRRTFSSPENRVYSTDNEPLVSSIFIVHTTFYIHFAPSEGVNYCDKHVCMSVGCMSQKSQVQTSWNFLYVLTVAMTRSSSDDTLCTSGFVDNVMFAHNRPGIIDPSRAYTQGRTRGKVRHLWLPCWWWSAFSASVIRISAVLLRKWCPSKKHFAELAPTKWRKNSWHRYDMKKLRHCHPLYC